MSTRDVMEFSMETLLEDLRSVVDGLAIEQFVLEAPNQMTPVGLTFAALHPERVSHLIIRSGAARNRDLWTRRIASTHDMLTNAPDVYRTAVAAMAFGATAADEQAAFMAQCADEHVAKRMYDAQATLDATAVLPEIHAPALITAEADDQVFRQGSITKLAASMGASLVVIAPPRGTLDAWSMSAVPTILSFLADQGVIEDRVDSQGQTSAAIAAAPSAFRTILFTDIVGHTEMMQRLGDAKGRDVLREHERITRELLKQHGGAEVKTMGDGFMASFGSVTSAIECAIALQRAFDGALTRPFGPPSPSGGDGRGGDERVAIRIGLNAGEPIAGVSRRVDSSALFSAGFAAAISCQCSRYVQCF